MLITNGWIMTFKQANRRSDDGRSRTGAAQLAGTSNGPRGGPLTRANGDRDRGYGVELLAARPEHGPADRFPGGNRKPLRCRASAPRSRRIGQVIAAIATLTIVGCGGGTPTAPTPPPTPPPSARLVVVAGDLDLPDWPCPTGECRYGFTFRNEGPDCAAAVKGTLRLSRANGDAIATDEWAIDAARVIRPQEAVSVQDGPLPVSALVTLGTEDGRYAVTFVFDAVRCQ